MAQPTPAEFRTEFAEFRLLTDAVILAKLEQAYRRVGESWGELRDDGAKLLAAHLLAMSPLAEPSRKSVKGGGKTVYLEEYERLLEQARVFGTTVTVDVAPPPGD